MKRPPSRARIIDFPLLPTRMLDSIPKKLRRRAQDYVRELSKLYWPPGRPAPRAVQVMGNNCFVYANETVGRSLTLGHAHEAAESELFRNVIRPADICFDVGANTGYFTTLFSTLASRGSVHAFEPLPANYHLLCASVACNRFRHTIVNLAAVGACQGVSAFVQTADSAYSSFRRTARDEAVDTVEVKVVTLDEYVVGRSLSRLDILKVDVEGGERDVVLGARELLSDHARRPRLVMLELATKNQSAFGHSVMDVVRLMSELGYVAYRLGVRGQLQTFTAEDVDLFYNVFFAPQQA